MRRAYNSEFVFHDEIMIGINLGADYTSEHEWGIKDIKSSFGIPSGAKDWGIARRKITRVPDSITFGWTTGFDGKGEGFYLYGSYNTMKPDFSKYRELQFYKDEIFCAWDERTFGVFSTSDKEIGYLHQIYDAFLNLDGVIFLGGGSVFQNSGLVLGIASRLPLEFLNNWYKSDKDHYDLDQEVEMTGIRQLLKEKEKGYYALHPKRQKDGSIRYWLNPMDQQAENYGWYTIDDLKEWAEGKGKIPMATGGKR